MRCVSARCDEPELLDRSGHDPAILSGNLADIRRVNHFLGGTWLTLRALERLTADLPAGSDLGIVDLATGSADIPEAVARWATRRGLRAQIVATDLNAEMLAQAPACGSASVRLAVADARRLPFPARSFHIAMCSLVLHHLHPDDARIMLREMRRISRRGVIVNDLIRTRVGYVGAWLITHLFSRNPLTRHDGPLSVRRAYTPAEMIALADAAGLGPVAFESLLGFRVAMIARSAR